MTETIAKTQNIKALCRIKNSRQPGVICVLKGSITKDDYGWLVRAESPCTGCIIRKGPVAIRVVTTQQNPENFWNPGKINVVNQCNQLEIKPNNYHLLA